MENFEEKREQQRFKIENCPISLCLSDDDVVDAMINDLSGGGIQIYCDRISAHKVQHEYESTREKASTRFPVSFILPIGDGQDRVEADCQLAYIVKQENDTYAIGLEFVDMEVGCQSTLTAYVKGKEIHEQIP